VHSQKCKILHQIRAREAQIRTGMALELDGPETPLSHVPPVLEKD